MAKLEQYREYIQNLLTKYGSYKPLEEDVEIQLIFQYGSVKDNCRLG